VFFFVRFVEIIDAFLTAESAEQHRGKKYKCSSLRSLRAQRLKSFKI
jgi:hypothetical protein